ncbi:MAG: hypothetical protein PWQ93_213 [Clostridiales bacterium]|nr:hypothetical protein [Clostridiales bacterium]
MFKVTNAAKERIREILNDVPQPTPDMGMRIYTLPADQDTYLVGLAVERRPDTTDIKLEIQDVIFYVDSSESEYIDGITIDFDFDGVESVFQVRFQNECDISCSDCIRIGSCGFNN